MQEQTVSVAADVQNILGEGPLWCPEQQVLWWIDIKSSQLFQLKPGTAQHGDQVKQWDLPERAGSLGLNEEGRLVVAFESGFALYTPETQAIEWLAKIEPDLAHTRMNDGRCDHFGRFLAGSMVEGERPEGQAKGGLYSIDADINILQLEQGVDISNSLCWSPDNSIMYYCDTPKRCIWAYDYDGKQGTVSNRRVFVETEEGCFPDGSVVDSEGYLWNAQWGASKLVRYSPEGKVDRELMLPISQPTCPAFGGEDLRTLYITSASEDLSDEALAKEPKAGALFKVNVEVPGLAEGRFKT